VALVSPLENAAQALGEAMRAAEFGQRLQAYHPSTRGGDMSLDSLRAYEVNSGPAIRRTLQTLSMAKAAGEQLTLTDEDRVYIEWVGRALLAVQRIAGRCWAPTRPELRTLVIDEDDLGPGGSAYLSKTREFTPGPALRFAGLDSPPVVSAIDSLVECCRATPCFEAAREQLVRLESNRALRDRLVRMRQGVVRRIAPQPGMRVGEVQSRAHSIVLAAYEDADPETLVLANAVRGYNQLINYVVWALLGFAEHGTTTYFGPGSGPVRVRRYHRLFWIHFATWDLDDFPGNPPVPVVLQTGTPVDGLYILEGSLFMFSGRELVDVHARRIRDLEDAPVPSAPRP
jgi:hypothetical protein